MEQRQGLLTARPLAAVNPTRQWIVAALLFGLMLIDGIRQGGFWPADAFVAAAGAVVLLVAAAVANPLDRRSGCVVVALILLAVWWGFRAATTDSIGAVLPLGATCVAFAGAFAAARPLRGPARQVAGLGVTALGAAGSLVGFAGLVWRWFPMAMPAQGLWRLSTTLTYSDAAGLALGMCLLVALGIDRHPWLARIAVCLCTGGLLAAQSRGALLAVACACVVVPWRRYLSLLTPLLAGGALGIVAVATSPDAGPVPWLGVALVVAVGIAAVPATRLRPLVQGPRARMTAGLLVLGAVVISVFLLHHEIALRTLAPSDHDRSVEWSTALHQWGSAPFLGVGPDRLLVFHASESTTYAHFVHNEYLQIAADAGVVGLLLLLAAGAAIFRATRRFDVLSSCACAALVCCAVGAAFDYDWHLTVVGFVGGWCAGLAARADTAETREHHGEPGEDGQRGRNARGATRTATYAGNATHVGSTSTVTL
ncbi:MAG TPA: O-antigen ligase family protein [Acidimicrobiales bacterium]